MAMGCFLTAGTYTVDILVCHLNALTVRLRARRYMNMDRTLLR
nr:MAG TPA: hypothetical protein [Caudoviricetes sp.]